MPLTFVYIGEVGAKSRNRFQNGGAIGPIQRLDGLGIEVLYGLLVAATDPVLSTGISVEGVDGLGDSHL